MFSLEKSLCLTREGEESSNKTLCLCCYVHSFTFLMIRCGRMNDVVTTYSFRYCFCPASLADMTAWNVYQVLQFIAYRFPLPLL